MLGLITTPKYTQANQVGVLIATLKITQPLWSQLFRPTELTSQLPN